MKRKSIFGVLFVSLFWMSGMAIGQVMMDFEEEALGAQGWFHGWGDGLTAVNRIDDATWGGVLELTYDAADGGNGALMTDPLEIGWAEDVVGAHYYSFDVYIPEDFPEDALIKIWGQDVVNWNWIDYKYSNSGMEGGRPMNTDGWTTISFDVMRALETAYNDDFVPWSCKGGIEAYFTTAWSGTILLDNFTLWGVEPEVMADFDDPALGTAGWGTGWGGVIVEQVEHIDFGGVMSMTYDNAGGSGDATSISPLDAGWTPEAEGASFISYNVWFPEDFPANAVVKCWNQTMEGGWTWIDYKYSNNGESGYWSIQTGDWNVLTFPYRYATEMYDSMVPWNSQGGLEIWFADAWAGTVYVDDIMLHDEMVGMFWTMADFENEDGGTQGFGNTGWNMAMTGIGWAADPTEMSEGILNTTWDFDLDPSRKAQFVNGSVDLLWTEDEETMEITQGATAVTMDVFVPEDFPTGATFGFWATDFDTWSWTEYSYYLAEETTRVDSTTLMRGQWNTMTYDVVDANETWGDNFNPVGTIRMGIQVMIPAGVPNWTGDIWFDNFTAVGVEAPAGALMSPPVVVNTQGSGVNEVTWTDGEENLQETYNVYMSEMPITDVSAEGVIQIATGVPRGTQYWNHGTYTTVPESFTRYYAVTAQALDGTLADLQEVSTAGPITNISRETAKARYVADFSEYWVLDNDLTEFDPFSDHELLPESAYGPESEAWDIYSVDLNYRVTFVADDNYLYMGANVWDDDPTGSGQSWEGDAIEFFMGFYDIADLTVYHDYGDVGSEGTGDYRISFHSAGHTESGGSSPYEYAGLDYVTEQHSFGYDIEARFDLAVFGPEALAMPGLGSMLPIRIDCNDMDPVNGDEERTLQIHSLGQSNASNWLRPSSWGYLEIYDESILECAPDGDVNLDGSLDVLDVVMMVGHILGTAVLPDDQICHGDMNTDTNVDILDIVFMVDQILNRSTEASATEASIHEMDGSVSILADGFVGGVQMTLTHGDNFSIELGDAYIGEYHTAEGTTRLIMVHPGEDLFTAAGEFEISEVIVASGNGYVETEIAENFALLSNYPNPFNPTTRIEYYLPSEGNVRISVYNALGQQVAALADQVDSKGFHSLQWNGTNDASAVVPSGIYLVRMEHNGSVVSHKVTFMK